MTTYPTVDLDKSQYRAVIGSCSSEIPAIVLDGVHDTFEAAQARAKRVAAAMIAAGEMGRVGRVGFSGIRPAGMPRNARVQ